MSPGRSRKRPWRMWPGCCRSSRCSTVGRRSFPAASVSAWRWAARWCAIRLLFLFDEPLSNLDAKLRVEMRMEIKRLHQRIGATIVYVTHDQIEAMTMATRIAVMHQGEVQQFADPDTVYRYPANLFVARFMGSPPMNTMPARLEVEDGGPVVVIGAGRPDEVRLRLQGYEAAAAFRSSEVVLRDQAGMYCRGEPRVFGRIGRAHRHQCAG